MENGRKGNWKREGKGVKGRSARGKGDGCKGRE